MTLGKFSLGVGDRFAHQARAQLRACLLASQQGVEVIPVWNKSNREHITIGSEPASTRAAADEAVKALDWTSSYHVDADHVRLGTVDRFLTSSDFFTIDVADWIGRQAETMAVEKFVDHHPELIGRISVPGIERPFDTTRRQIEVMAGKYLLAVQEAGRIYRRIAQVKSDGNFITEVSMDETDQPQTPPELLIILAALAEESIPLQTIAPKFTGRFNKGVDYAGDVRRFEEEFSQDLAVLGYAVQAYHLPPTLKLSVHSGSDKFSIYGPMRRAVEGADAGLHLKTAGTTWLEEVIGLAEAGGRGLALAKQIYAGAFEHLEELCAPYASVIDIHRTALPSVQTVKVWSSEQFVSALRHDPKNPGYNPHLRQLLHVGYKVAARMGQRFLDALAECEEVIGRNVTENLFERHIRPLFLNKAPPPH